MGYTAGLCLKAQQPNQTNSENKGQAESACLPMCEALGSTPSTWVGAKGSAGGRDGVENNNKDGGDGVG